MARTIGIGIQDFHKIIDNNCFYVDKTDFIKEWWENKDDVTLITRPRRFGKTLTMNMTEQFFSVQYADRKDLFEGLSIWKDEKYQKLQGTYPVISISFANVKEINYVAARKRIIRLLVELYSRHAYLLNNSVLEDGDRDFFKQVTVNMDDIDATLAIQYLSRYLYQYYGKRVIILLDEYDTPMQEAYVNGYWEELVSFTRSLFNSTFKTNPYMERGLMTGITRVSKESIFSDLNNLEIVTTTSDKYETAFGFTEQEVFQAMEEYGISKKEAVKSWYDGFRFGEYEGIYNPWSVLNYLDKRKLKTYWANTSSNSLAEKLIREGSRNIKIIMEDLLEQKTFHTRIDEQIVFSDLGRNETAVWSLLLASGYLKVKNYTINEELGEEEYELGLTNKEVRIMFRQMITGWFSSFTSSYNDFIKALLAEDIKKMNTYMNEVALATFSFFDTGKNPSNKTEPERFYHGFVLGLMVDLSGRYTITSNRESGFGRYDVLLEPKDKKDNAIILEFKVYDADEEESLQNTVNSALQQIEDKRYATSLEAKGISADRIRKYGFAFKGKEVLIG